MIETAGFESEVHNAETEDGYILKVHRIKKANGNYKTAPVFMMHGLTGLNVEFRNFYPKIHWNTFHLAQPRLQIIFVQVRRLLYVRNLTMKIVPTFQNNYIPKWLHF